MRRYLFQVMLIFSWIFSESNSIEKPIIVIIPSFNNKEWYIKNLNSVFSQRYFNFKVIYIDDCSDDGTAMLVQNYLADHKYEDKCTFIKNDQRYGPLYNRYRAIHSCPDDAIIVLLDGDDWLAHDEVLSYLNYIYSDSSIYMTVGNAAKSSTGQKIGHRDYTQDEWDLFGIRQLGFRGVHPRTFYAWLFKKIRLQDLFEGTQLYPMATDIACLLPMFEMAQGHYKYITDILYIYNDQNPLNMARQGFQTQIYCDMMIRNKQTYEKLSYEQVPPITQEPMPGLGCITFTMGHHDTYSFIEHCVDQKVMFDSFIAIGSQDHKAEVFAPITQSLQFISLACDLQTIYSFRVNIKDRIKGLVQVMNSEYVLIMADEFLNNSSINLKELCKSLQDTQAHSLVIGSIPAPTVNSYYTYKTNQHSHTYIARPWMFSQSFNSLQDCLGILIRRDVLLATLESMIVFYPNFYTFLAAWHSCIPTESVLLMSFLNK